MDQPGRLGRKSTRIAAAGAVAAVGAVLAGTLMASAATPALPKRTPAQLLVGMRHATLPSAMTAVITQTANLGFPALPNLPGLSSSTLSAASLITGTHTVDIWYAGPRKVRIALPVSFGETDLRVNGRQVWLWDSKAQTATRYILPARFPMPAGVQMPAGLRPPLRPIVSCARRHVVAGVVRIGGKKVPARRVVVRVPGHEVPLRLIRLCVHGQVLPAGKPGGNVKPGQVAIPALQAMTPLQVANRLLAAVGPTTKVTVPGTVTVAGRAAYQLSIAPRSSSSLIGQILIAVDSKTSLPLRLQVFARGSSSPAFQIGFTSLSFGQPAASNFTFTPPPGAKVKTVRLPDGGAAGLPGFAPGIGLPGWIGVPGGPVALPRRIGTVLPGPVIRAQLRHIRLPGHVHGLSAKQLARMRAELRKAIAAQRAGVNQIPLTAGAAPHVLGSGWLSVLVLPSTPKVSVYIQSTGPKGLAESATFHEIGGPPPASTLGALLRTLLKTATAVHGSWGSGRLLRTSLFSVLVTSKGDVLIGAVTPSVLYADAAKVK
jgi:outer membrane lipoprotein-sorting protein